MPKYIYETIPESCCEQPQYFEIEQPENEAPLTRHPHTGLAIRRVVISGAGELTAKPADDGDSCCCGPSGCCD